MIDPAWIAVLAPVVMVIAMAIGVWRRALSGRPAIPRIPAGAAFGEAGASGRALGGLFTRMSRANGCLLVWVDRQRLVVTMAFPFSLLVGSALGRLEVDEPVAHITRVTADRSWGRPVLRIEFAAADRMPVELTVADEAGLIAALGLKAEGDRPLRTRDGIRWNSIIPRAFACVWGTLAVGIAGSGLINDLTLCNQGVQTRGEVVHIGPKQDEVHFRAGGRDYVFVPNVAMPNRPKDTTVCYQSNHPARATTGDAIPFEALFTLAGTLMLAFGVFGSRLIPGWSRPR